jgi:hypothetical protein
VHNCLSPICSSISQAIQARSHAPVRWHSHGLHMALRSASGFDQISIRRGVPALRYPVGGGWWRS